ncbi:MAG: hypothetical protein NT158_01950, partial [Cyanobacteria bacterium]|nr:hypothetical protein [Cyanobacteriota bacterium]
GQIRRVVLSRFPYAVYFREQDTEILVIALHGRQDPRRWKQCTRMGIGDAECLQVAEVACAAPVHRHDGVYLQGPLLRDLPSNSPPRSIRSGPWRIGEPCTSPSR